MPVLASLPDQRLIVLGALSAQRDMDLDMKQTRHILTGMPVLMPHKACVRCFLHTHADASARPTFRASCSACSAAFTAQMTARMLAQHLRSSLTCGAVQEPRQVLVHQELHVPPDETLRAPHGRPVRLRVRVRHLPMAILAAQTGAFAGFRF